MPPVEQSRDFVRRRSHGGLLRDRGGGGGGGGKLHGFRVRRSVMAMKLTNISALTKHHWLHCVMCAIPSFIPPFFARLKWPCKQKRRKKAGESQGNSADRQANYEIKNEARRQWRRRRQSQRQQRWRRKLVLISFPIFSFSLSCPFFHFVCLIFRPFSGGRGCCC